MTNRWQVWVIIFWIQQGHELKLWHHFPQASASTERTEEKNRWCNETHMTVLFLPVTHVQPHSLEQKTKQDPSPKSQITSLQIKGKSKWKPFWIPVVDAATPLYQGNCQEHIQIELICADESVLQGSCYMTFYPRFSQNVESSASLPLWGDAAQEGADRTKQSCKSFQAGVENEWNQVYQAVERRQDSNAFIS